MADYTPKPEEARDSYVQREAWAGEDEAKATSAFDRMIEDVRQVANPWPALHKRYAASKTAGLGSQLTSTELTDRIQTELRNAFATGAIWQYRQGHSSMHEGSGS